MTKKRLANQYSGGNLITQREADRINNWIRHINKMIRERDLYVGVSTRLAEARNYLQEALEQSDR